MLKDKSIVRISFIIIAAILALTIMFLDGTKSEDIPVSNVSEYETRLFDKTKVHEIEILIGDWDVFIENAPKENYMPCTLVIDGENSLMWAYAQRETTHVDLLKVWSGAIQSENRV